MNLGKWKHGLKPAVPDPQPIDAKEATAAAPLLQAACQEQGLAVQALRSVAKHAGTGHTGRVA